MKAFALLALALAGSLICASADAQTVDTPSATALQYTLEDSAAQQHRERIVTGIGGLVIGTAFVSIGTGLLVDNYSKTSTFGSEGGTGMFMVVSGGITLLVTPVIFFWRSDMERFSDRTRALAAKGDLAAMERLLDSHARRERTLRLIAGTTSLVAAAVITPIGVVSTISNGSLNDDSRTTAGGAIAVIDTILIAEGLRFLIEASHAEQVQHAWFASTGRPMGFDIIPSVGPGGGGLKATFVF